MNIQGKYIVILGAGESGVGAALLAKNKGAQVFVSDKGQIETLFLEELKEADIEFEQQQHTIDKILNADLIIKSPGIPDKVELIKKAKEKGIKVISEIEFASYFYDGKTICITGSNGKTTTTMLVYHILKKAKFSVGLAGNIGKSFARQLINNDFEWYVLELSSFQLDDMFEFKADIAILTNISPDHLDRYEYKLANYVNSKFRILQNQTENDWFIYNADDEQTAIALKNIKTKMNLLPFSMNKKIEFGAYADNRNININIKEQFSMSIHDLALKGKHNTQNSLAAGLAAKVLEIRNETLRQSFEDFVNVEHRLEFVAKVNGIEFINDSKATNVNATWYALESMDKPCVWIVGGVDKGNDYQELIPLIKEKVKAIICLGVDNQKIIDSFSNEVETIVEARTAMEAVAYGYQLAKKEETVLLSPACASFDLFENYEDRGKQFKAAVRSL